MQGANIANYNHASIGSYKAYSGWVHFYHSAYHKLWSHPIYKNTYHHFNNATYNENTSCEQVECCIESGSSCCSDSYNFYCIFEIN